jgi:hypothetical protein
VLTGELAIFCKKIGQKGVTRRAHGARSFFCRLSVRPAASLAAYPDQERQDLDKILDQTAAAPALRPMPVVVLTASDKFVDVIPKQVQAGELPPDTPPDLGAVLDRAWPAAQNELAALGPGAVHITDTHSGHFIMIDNAPVVIQAIRMVVDPVRAGQTSLKPGHPGALN